MADKLFLFPHLLNALQKANQTLHDRTPPGASVLVTEPVSGGVRVVVGPFFGIDKARRFVRKMRNVRCHSTSKPLTVTEAREKGLGPNPKSDIGHWDSGYYFVEVTQVFPNQNEKG